jgi:peptidoglycan/xylan/chitin deacetylase (PgdA/CDA1 family)
MKLLDRVALKIARSVPVNPVKSRLTQAVASISFDDIPTSAARVGAPMLEAAGLRGTFYVCGAHTGHTFEDREQHVAEDLQRLHAAGHEVACHSYAHPDVTRLDDAGRAADTAANAAFLRQTLGDVMPVSFAYPYGAVSIPAKAFYARQFFTCRGVYAGVNAGVMDFSDLLAVGVERRQFDIGRVRALIAEAKARAGWLVFFTHDVAAEPTPYGCTPADLAAVIEALAEAGVETLPVKAAAARVMFG